MAYCPECGSEVAPNDVFCAYCGIGLPNVITEPEAKDSSIEYSPTSDLSKESSLDEIIKTEENFIEVEKPVELPIEVNESDELPNTPVVLQETVANEIKKEVVEVEPSEISRDFQESEEIIENQAEMLPPELSIKDDSITLPDNYPVAFEPFETPAKTENEEINNESAFSDELIKIESSKFKEPESLNAEEDNNFAIDKKLDEEVETAIEEISVGEVDSQNEEKSPLVEREISFDQTIVDGYLPPTIQTEVEQPIAPIDEPIEVDEEDKLQSVLAEIDLNLQNQNEIEAQKIVQPIQNSGEIIPTAANLQQEFAPIQREDEIISPSASNYSSDIQPVIASSFESPALNEEQAQPELVLDKIETEVEVADKVQPIADVEDSLIEDEPPTLLAQEINVPIAKAIAPPISTPLEIDVAENEARSFTNPNIGGVDKDNRSKTKLKPLDEGTVLNFRYEVVRKIGGGGMGAVYLATDKNLGGVLRAVKEMVQSYIEDDQQEKAINDFKRESLLLTSLEHQSIPTIYDYFFDEKEARFYLVMKYISGGDLAARLRAAPEGRIDEVSVTEWAIQITDVLDYLHNRQPPIVYRDLKPSNIMIDGNTGKVMIIDFGIARWVNKEEKGVTAVGTMGYAPPELFSGNVEPRSDIYSLGSTMFHLLTGADPQSNPLLIFDFNKNPKPRQINSQLSDQMEQILMRAVEYNSSQRFSNALEMKEELIRHMENLKKGSVTFGVVNTSAGTPINSNVPVFCGFCGQKIVATDMFCPFCGAQQPLAAQSKQLAQPPVYASKNYFQD